MSLIAFTPSIENRGATGAGVLEDSSHAACQR